MGKGVTNASAVEILPAISSARTGGLSSVRCPTHIGSDAKPGRAGRPQMCVATGAWSRGGRRSLNPQVNPLSMYRLAHDNADVPRPWRDADFLPVVGIANGQDARGDLKSMDKGGRPRRYPEFESDFDLEQALGRLPRIPQDRHRTRYGHRLRRC